MADKIVLGMGIALAAISIVMLSSMVINSSDGEVTGVPPSSPTPPSTTTNSNLDSVVITQHKSGCLGRCPAYEVTIFGNGTVFYRGVAYVEEIANRTFSISQEAVNGLVQEFYKIDFFSRKDSYGSFAEDAPIYATSLMAEGKEKGIAISASGIRNDADAQHLLALQGKIEKAAGIEHSVAQ